MVNVVRRFISSGWSTTVVVTLFALVLLFPLYWMFMTSVLPSDVVLSRTPPLIPPLSKINFDAYVVVTARKPIFQWFANSAVVTASATVVSMFVSTLAGYSLSRFRTRGGLAMGYTLLLNRMLPGSLLVIPLYFMFAQARLINNPISLVIANVTHIVPFATWMMKGFFDSIPGELEESAMVDGCTRLQAMRKVILPLTLPGLAATGIYSAILAWSEFLFARTLMTDPARWTMTVGTVSFIGEHTVNWSSLMASGVISVAPLLLVFLFLEPYLVSGMTSGSVKG